MSTPYPTFDAALEHFRSFLANNDQPTEIQFVFREDVYYSNVNTLCIVSPIPASNLLLAATAYDIGKLKDQVVVKALGKFPNTIIATIWYPCTERHRPQGWDQGLRYAIVKPLPSAIHVSGGWQWFTRKFGLQYRRFQRLASDSILNSSEIRSTNVPRQSDITA